ncbi:MAG: hypothetical protein FWC32_00290, partial [Firmicutes bacterium]|nr:hypothetical protein [Bacillota bacterium]
KGFSAWNKMTYKELEEMQLKALRWNDEVMNGECFYPWTTFEHPQLGAMEIGGWNLKEGRQNPPVKLLEEEVAKIHNFTLMHLESLPQLAITDARCERVGDNVWRVTAAVENMGFLPSSSTHKAIANKITAPVKAEICGDVKVLQGETEIDLGHFVGRSAANSMGPYGSTSPAGRRKKVEWLVEATAGAEVCIRAKGERAGTVRCTLMLEM